MYTFRLIFDAAAHDAMWARILSAPEPYRPQYIHDGERPAAGERRPCRDARDIPGHDRGRGRSFFLRCAAGSLYVTPRGDGWVLVGHPEDAPHQMVAFLRHAVGPGLIFAYAACAAEAAHRHLLRVPRPSGHTEGTVGLDVRHYVPGLYWTTVLSGQLAARHRVDIPALVAAASDHEQRGDAHILEFFPDPTRWQEEAARLSALMGRAGQFFDKSALARTDAPVATLQDALAILGRWR